MNEGERLRYLRKELLGLTLEKFGAIVGLKKNSLSQIENGVNSLSGQLIISICNANWNGRRVSETWLRTGEGDPFEPEPEDEIGRLARAHNLDENYASILRGLVQLDGEYQRMAVEFLMETAGRIAGKEKGWWKEEGENGEASGAIGSTKEEAEDDEGGYDEIERKVEAYRQGLLDEKEARERLEAM